MELQWPLIIFTTLLAWSCGVFASQAALALVGEGKKVQVPALVTSVVLLAVSGIAVFFHLQHWERIFNGFGHITSGITQELIAIVVFVVVAVVYFAMLRKSEDGGSVPKWIAIVAIAISVILAIVSAHSYMMAARPAWDTVVWPITMLLSGGAAGVLTVMAMLAGVDGAAVATKTGGTMAVALSALSAVATIALVVVWQTSAGAFANVGYHFDPTSPNSPLIDAAAEMNVFSGEFAPIVWVGIVIVGSILPLALAILGKRQADAGKPRSWLAMGAIGTVCLLAGAVCLRVVFYELGLSVFMFY